MAKKDVSQTETTNEQPIERPPALGLDDGSQPPTPDSPLAADDKLPRQGAVNIICPYCQIRCEANRSDPLVTKYYCPNRPACTYMQKVPRPEFQRRLNRQRKRDEAQEGFGARD